MEHMIGFLEGRPQITGDQLLLIVGGVGYVVEVAQPALLQLREATTAQLFIHTFVREDRLELYGFLNQDEKQLFQYILDVSGIGPKTALTICGLGASAIIQAVQEATVSTFTALPRIGKKQAQKLIIELKGKLGSLKELSLADADPVTAEVRAALESLGYAERDVERVVSAIDVTELTVPAALKLALKELTKK
jgi:holliday junction DNA helicase RuvA